MSPSEPAASRTILLAEDEPGFAEAMVVLLDLEGHHVLHAVNGHAALELLALNRCDLIVTDYSMPGMSGDQLVRAVRADPALRNIPIVLATAVQSPDPATLSAVDAYLRKPFMLDRLIGLIAKLT